ncbi:RNA-binding protein [Roseospira goensis]|uniref:YlxR domain-containing protein n=1 Tax=Roseospira goensis TaxID=391922 RepID=A0A7W6S0Y9_9PROT|nr:RNA-binding protein [Roseospira goensis]MBB4286197.1 hypothetical protein [Roseospira goensis]
MAAPSPERATGGDAEEDPMPSGHRRCIATREVRPMAGLLRFVVDPDGQVVPDVDRRLPGRGLWLSPSRDMIEMAARKRLFARAARRAVTVPPDLADRVEALLVRRGLDLIGLARRAGQVVSGFEKVRSRLREASSAGLPAVLLAARDGGDDGRGKVAALAAAVGRASASGGGTGAAMPMVVGFDAAELGRPLGRERVVHGALEPGRLARTFLESCDLLAGFRPGPMTLSAADVLAETRRDPPDRRGEESRLTGGAQD